MLFSFLNVSPAAELRIRRKHSATNTLTKRRLKILEQDRIQRFENSLRVEEVVAEVVAECVDAVSKMRLDRRGVVLPPIRKKVVKLEEQADKESRKRKHIWQTWVARSRAIFMLLHPDIFDGNCAEASEALGIPRSTLLG